MKENLNENRNDDLNQEPIPSSSSKRGKAMQAALLSALVIPGAGQLYNCQWGKGIGILLVFLVASLAVLIPITLAIVGYYISLGSGNIDNAAQALKPISEEWVHLLVLLVASLGIYIYSIVDAYRFRMRK